MAVVSFWVNQTHLLLLPDCPFPVAGAMDMELADVNAEIVEIVVESSLVPN